MSEAERRETREIIRLVDRVGADSLIKNALFENAVLVGPVVLALLDNVRIEGCVFDSPPEVLFIDVGPEPRSVSGVVGIRDAAFLNCEFRNIGIIGPTESIEHMKKGLTEDEGHATPRPPALRLDPAAQTRTADLASAQAAHSEAHQPLA
jgi:hypothetical protein